MDSVDVKQQRRLELRFCVKVEVAVLGSRSLLMVSVDLIQSNIRRSLEPSGLSAQVVDGDDDVELHVLGCRVDILGTNCDQCVCMVQCCFPSTETVRLI